jgi:hypothetical protein
MGINRFLHHKIEMRTEKQNAGNSPPKIGLRRSVSMHDKIDLRKKKRTAMHHKIDMSPKIGTKKLICRIL